MQCLTVILIMIAKASISKVQSLILSHHTLSKPPLSLAHWLNLLWQRNEQNPSLLTPESIRGASWSTVTELGLSKRVEEANTRAAKAAINDCFAVLNAATRHESAEKHRSLGKIRGPTAPVPEHADVADSKLPGLVLAFETVPFSVFVQKLKRANEGKTVTLEIAEACWWEAIDKLLKMNKVRGSAAKRMVDDAGKIVKQGRKKWQDEEAADDAGEMAPTK